MTTPHTRYAPRTGGAYDSHHRTAGIAGRTRRRGGSVAARGAGAAVVTGAHRFFLTPEPHDPEAGDRRVSRRLAQALRPRLAGSPTPYPEVNYLIDDCWEM